MARIVPNHSAFRKRNDSRVTALLCEIRAPSQQRPVKMNTFRRGFAGRAHAALRLLHGDVECGVDGEVELVECAAVVKQIEKEAGAEQRVQPNGQMLSEPPAPMDLQSGEEFPKSE